MFKDLRNHRGQAHALQYAMTFFLVIAVVSSMTVYVKRVIQAKIRDARAFMAYDVNAVYAGANVLRIEYEPYYMNSLANKYEDTTDIESINPVPGTEGRYLTGIASTTTSNSIANYLPPGDAD